MGLAAHRACPAAVFAARLRPQPGVHLQVLEALLALQLAQRCQPVEDGGVTVPRIANRATWLTVVGAVAEPAPGGELTDVCEDGVNAHLGVPHTHLAHARSIDEQPAAG